MVSEVIGSRRRGSRREGSRMRTKTILGTCRSIVWHDENEVGTTTTTTVVISSLPTKVKGEDPISNAVMQ